MKNIWLICRKDLKSYYTTWIAYSLFTRVALVFGFFFYVAAAIFATRSMQASMMGGGMPMDVNEWVIRPLLMNVAVISLFLIPMIGMRLFAEEKNSGTIELLLTSPVRDLEIVLGKWLGGLLFYCCLLGIAALNLGFLFFYGQPDWKPVVLGFLGLVLQGGALLAVCTFLSSLTRNQIIAADAGFTICLLLWVLDWVSAYETAAWAKVMSYLSLSTHFEQFAKGVLDSRDLVYYFSMIFLWLFLTTRSVESLRWRS
ncbi:MAG: ABC transporter permease [Bryobacteraceae bacterium]|jgi:ABC-2 type transport system permease protein